MSYEVISKRDLVRLGIEFDTKEETDLFLKIVREEIEVRLGRKIAEGKTAAQMDEFEKSSGPAAERWLNRYCPNYPQLIFSVEKEVKNELRRYRKKISGAHSTWFYNTPLSELGLSMITYKCIQGAGLKTIGDVMDRVPLSVPGLGRSGEQELRERIDSFMT